MNFDLSIMDLDPLFPIPLLCKHWANIMSASAAGRAICAVIMGPPGSGKGTISSRIVSTFGLHHLSSGDLLRTHISRATALGREAQRYISDGKLVPDRMMTTLILRSVEEAKHTWLLDGFPRTVAQAEALFERVELDTVINLDVPFHTIIERIRGRWVHVPSGRVYHDEFNPPRVAGCDNITMEPLIQRPDDHPDTVKQRLQHYETQTHPVLHYFQERGLLNTFSGTESDVIWPQVKDHLCTISNNRTS